MESERVPEDFFDEYIEFDDGNENPDMSDGSADGHSDKENTPINVKVKNHKQLKTNQQQLNLMIAFAKGITEVIWFNFSLIVAKTFRSQ